VLIMAVVSLMTLMGTTLSGILAVALPKVAGDIGLEDGLLLWPASVYSLSCGCTLLLFGSLSDVVGARTNYLVGSFLSSGWIVACGLSRTGVQLIVFRTLHGIAISMCLPSSVSILSRNFGPGSRRNAAFAMLGAAQPTGFLLGLVIGGILTDLVSWRWCFYAIAIVNAVVFILAYFAVPPDAKPRGTMMQRFRREADWVGVFIMSSALALLSYVLAAVTVDSRSIHSPANIAMLVLSVLLFPVFGLWVHRQEKHGLPALIPNSLWSNSVFLCISLLVFLAWATVTANQYFLALFFEKVQLLSAFSTSLRFLAMVVTGVMANVATGLLVHRVRANLLIGGSLVLSAVTPLLMALADSTLPYWNMAFPATLLSPIAADVVLTIANLAIINIFPPETHGLAGGVTNTLAQLGASLGLNLTAILASAVTMGSSYIDKASPAALELGYKAAFWASFGATLAMLAIAAVGLRNIGKVGAVKKS
jgi:MFS family permease